ncbi:MAG: triose-phosphate isomerase [Crocinitomicaceae bacterium]|jgi:triosephosphate isomerase (TIM)|nr:triose-phosphate isomerase [Crocinitomicaceae bacterium]MDP4685060.1 triose-phosphate isomerase [Crocinitomicaceae bacterium]MDP4866299.1 triose-phosphate isomerase [Crocinitomicaceae bacterium]MDP5011342.1 triose-phosphate isomerase [Crocinitomicaceae bacterium]MDP5098595.1 triose-phosphate isomerase [Crocinitomicaceae bacterium]
MRKNIVAGNWKMNLSSEQAFNLLNDCNSLVDSVEGVQLMVFPPALFIQQLIGNSSDHIFFGAQNCYPADKGAFTGEISIAQFKSIGVNHFLVGHSERREIFHEDNAFIKQKVDAILTAGSLVMFCCGEPLEIRENNTQMEYVRKQLDESLFHLSNTEIVNCSIAYEPVWAIGTGKTASSAQAEEMHAAIRTWIKEKYSEEISNAISILYGGSCNPTNAKELFACPNVDGGLIGGASLEAESFINIAKSF